MIRSLLFLALLLVPNAPVLAKDVELPGTIRLIDVDNGIVALKLLSSREVKNYSLASKDLPVTNAVGQPFKLANIKVGYRVVLKVADERDVLAVKVEWPALFGILKSVNAQAQQLHFLGEFRDYQVKLAPTTQYVIDAKPGEFAMLKAGQHVKVVFAEDGQTVLQVQAGKSVPPKDPYRIVTRNVGVLVGVDKERQVVKLIATVSYNPLTYVEYPYVDDAVVKVLFDYRPSGIATFDQLGELVKVIYVLDADQKKILALEAELPSYGRRKILAVDAERGKLTYDEDKKEKTLDLDANVKVLLPKGEGRLQDVAPGRLVNIGLSFDRRKVVRLYLWGK